MQRKPGLKWFANSWSGVPYDEFKTSKLSNNLIKTPQNFVEDSLLKKSPKTCHKNRCEVLSLGTL